MMNRLLNNAPFKLSVMGADYKISPCFRTVLHLIAVAKNTDILDEDKPYVLIRNFYKDFRKTPFFELRMMDGELISEFMNAINWFVRGGKEEREKDTDIKKRPVVCFEKDSHYIYEAFLKKGINLDLKTDMHWWEFKGHFAEFTECFLTRLMYLRSKNNKRDLSKDENKECSEIGWDIIELESAIILDEPDFEIF
jgi:hypothetical protein